MKPQEIALAATALADVLHDGRGTVHAWFQGDHAVRHALSRLAEELSHLYVKSGARHTWDALPEDGV